MAAERIIGVDFGTSTSVIRVKRYQDGKPVGDPLETKPVTFNMGSTMVPTLIQKLPSGDAYFGHEAEIAHRNAKTFQNFKVDIENPDEDIRQQARKLTAEFFQYLAKSYRAQSEGGHLGESDDREHTIISYPVKWSEETKAFMVRTAEDAGFPNVEGVDEAQAAIQAVTVQNADLLTRKGYFQDGVPVNILLIDMGAGTTDLVLCRHTPGVQPQTDILSTWPQGGNALFGGREVDTLLRSYISKAMPEDGTDIVLKKIGIEKYRAWKEGTISPALEKGEVVDYFSALDDLLNLMDIEAEYSVSRDSLENFASDYLRQFPELVNGCLSAAELSGDDVDLVILTGGHSRWYFVREMLSGELDRFGKIGLGKIQADPERIIPITLPQETVALGLVYGPLRADTPLHHKVLKMNYYEGGNELFCKTVGVAEFCEGDEFAVFNEDGNIIGTDKVISLDKDPDDKDSIYLQVQNTTNIDYEKADYLITLPTVEADYDTAIVAAMAEKGQVSRTVEFRYDGGDDVGWGRAFVMYVTNVNEEKGAVEGVSLKETLDESLKNGLTMEMSVFKQDKHIPFTWKNLKTRGFNAVFTGSSLNVEVGDIISNCEMDDFHSITCQRITSWKHRLHYIRTSGSSIAVANKAAEDNTFPLKYDPYSRIRSVIAAGGDHTVGVKKDGAVIAAGEKGQGSCDVDRWQDIVSVAAKWEYSSSFTAGLKKDGTVIAVGSFGFGTREMRSWRDIVAIAVGDHQTLGLKKDGTVIAAGWWKGEAKYNVNNWRDIVAIAAGNQHTVGLKKDGTVVAVGDNGWGSCNVSNWRDIVAIAAGGRIGPDSYTVGLKKDGTVVAVGDHRGGKCNVSDWRDIVAIAAGDSHTVGLKKDGTVIAVGANGAGQCNVSGWRDIVAIAAGYMHTVGLKKDGTIVAVGRQTNVGKLGKLF